VGLGDAGRSTHMAVDWSHTIKTDKGKDYGHEGRHTCKGVNLPKDQFNQRLTPG
jgi:hypothetical protein